jgi:hypothetical protein
MHPRIAICILLCVAAYGGGKAIFAWQPSDTLELPFGKKDRLPSPDGRYVLFGRTQNETKSGTPELWFEEPGLSKRVRLLELGGTARAAWSPDGTAFYVNDRWVSDRERSYLYDAASLDRTDLGKAILANDDRAARLATGHAYIGAGQWKDSQTVLVRFHGHTDEAPVVCFDLRYDVGRNGSVKKLAEHIAPVTDKGCD